MDLTIIADLLSSINPIVLGGVAGGFLIAGGAGLYVKRNKNKFIENTDPFAQPNDFKTLKTEDLEREFGSLTVQTKMLDEDESLFFDKSPKDKLADNELTQPSTKLVDEASVFDSFGKQDQALESLKKAVDIEKHDKEKVRLKILLSQYNIKKGKVSLDDIIKEYPSFHAKVSFGPDNTLSALMGSAIPKTDDALQHSIHKEIDKDFDIFADLPVLNESVKVEKQNVSHVSAQKNLFDDLPNIEEVTHSKNTEPSYLFKEEQAALIESESKIQGYTQLSLFDDLPPVNSVETVQKEQTNQSLHSSDNLQSTALDQFSWNSNNSQNNNTENETDKMLKELQAEADKVDQINEKEAMDDMQKFWQEFGNMVVDIKNEVAENHKPTKKTSNEEDIPFNLESHNVVNNEQSHQTPIVSTSPDLPSLSEAVYTVAEKAFEEKPTSVVNQNIQEQSYNQDLDPPVLKDIIESPSNGKILNDSVSNSTPIIQEQSPVMKENPVLAPASPTINPTSVLNTSVSSEVAGEISVKPQTYKVWANWIVNIEGQQVFRNHFINLKNPWGSIKAGEELYGGISRLSGKDISGKNYPWVLVSVFPLSKE